MYKRLTALFMTLVMTMSLFLIGCEQKTTTEETRLSEQSKITITDLAGETYTFDKPLDKVVIQWTAAGGPFFTMACLFGRDVTEHLCNLDNGLQAGRADMWEQFVKDMPELADIPDFGNFHTGTFDIEAAIASNPDAMIVPLQLRSTIQDSNADEKFAAAEIPIIYIDFHEETLENHTKSIEILGKLFQKEERAKEVVDFYTEHGQKVYDRVDELLKTNERPLVHMEVAWDSPDVAPAGFSNDYAWGKMVYDAGGTCTGEGIIQGEADLQPELLLSLKPEKLILAGSYWPKNPRSVRIGYQSTPEETKKLVSEFIHGRKGWDDLPAVKNGEIYIVPHALARDVFDCVCVEALAQDIWSDEFNDIDPTATLKEFFERFLPFTFGGNWFMKY